MGNPLKRIVLSLLLLIVGALGLRLYDIQRGPELQLWHTRFRMRWARMKSTMLTGTITSTKRMRSSVR